MSAKTKKPKEAKRYESVKLPTAAFALLDSFKAKYPNLTKTKLMTAALFAMRNADGDARTDALREANELDLQPAA